MTRVDTAGAFHTTRWSVVEAACGRDSSEAEVALSQLCEQYWYPLYVFVRRYGFDVEQAQDITQGFFARLLEKQDIAADRERGRFRTFLLSSIRHYISNELDRAQAQKRGGGLQLLSIDFANAEKQYVLEPSHNETPERAYARRWGLELLAQVLRELEKEFAAEGKTAVFEQLKPFLVPGAGDTPYRKLAVQMNMSENALRVAVHRMRMRYKTLLTRCVAETVSNTAQVAEEIAYLIESVGSAKNTTLPPVISQTDCLIYG